MRRADNSCRRFSAVVSFAILPFGRFPLTMWKVEFATCWIFPMSSLAEIWAGTAEFWTKLVISCRFVTYHLWREGGEIKSFLRSAVVVVVMCLCAEL